MTQVTRADIFGEAEARYRPISQPNDVDTMFPGYVGPHYVPHAGVLLLAINPGGGGDAAETASWDEKLFPLLKQFKAAKADQALLGFEQINEMWQTQAHLPPIWRIMDRCVVVTGQNLSQIAFMNCVPYRTRKDKKPPKASRIKAWELLIAPALEILSPRAIILLGLKARDVVSELYRGGIRTYAVQRTNGDKHVCAKAEATLAQIEWDFKC